MSQEEYQQHQAQQQSYKWHYSHVPSSLNSNHVSGSSSNHFSASGPERKGLVMSGEGNIYGKWGSIGCAGSRSSANPYVMSSAHNPYMNYDLDMSVRQPTSSYYSPYGEHSQMQRQQQYQQHIEQQIEYRRRQELHHHQQQQLYLQQQQQHHRMLQQQQQQFQQHSQQRQHQIMPPYLQQIKSEPMMDIDSDQLLVPSVQMDDLMIKPEPPDEHAFNSQYLRNQQMQQQQQLQYKLQQQQHQQQHQQQQQQQQYKLDQQMQHQSVFSQHHQHRHHQSITPTASSNSISSACAPPSSINASSLMLDKTAYPMMSSLIAPDVVTERLSSNYDQKQFLVREEENIYERKVEQRERSEKDEIKSQHQFLQEHHFNMPKEDIKEKQEDEKTEKEEKLQKSVNYQNVKQEVKSELKVEKSDAKQEVNRNKMFDEKYEKSMDKAEIKREILKKIEDEKLLLDIKIKEEKLDGDDDDDEAPEPLYPEVQIKEEPVNNSEELNSQQKTLNFPRRKVQTEKSDTLPICQRCKQVFLKKHSYMRHVAQSTCDIVEYDFKCTVCSMSFMSSEELYAHEKLHRLNKYFCQKYCGKHFDTIDSCESHEYTQHEYTTYVCNVCSAAFPRREILFSHMMHHRHQQRFHCPICRVWFRVPIELHQHRLSSPNYCGKFYGNEPNHDQLRSPEPSQHNSFNSPNYHLSNSRSSGMSSNPTDSLNRNYHSSSSAFYSPYDNMTYGHHGAFNSKNSSSSSSRKRRKSFSDDTPFLLDDLKTEIKCEPDTLLFEYPDATSTSRYDDYTNDSYASSSTNTSLSINKETNDNNGVPMNKSYYGSQGRQSSVVDDSEDSVCSVRRCGTRKSTNPTLQFFCFPKDEKYLNQWLHNLKMLNNPPDTNYDTYRICSLHFPKRCINRYSLAYWAVPTFNLGHDDVANLYQNREITNTLTSGENALCSMPGCKNQRGETNLKFYNFPKEVKMLIKWCQNARLPVYSKEPRHFCSRHFEDRCIGKFRLKPWSVPTLHLGTQFGRIHDNPKVLYLEEKKCCLPHCKRTRSSDFSLSLYRFPRDETLLRRWCYNLRLNPDMYRGKNHKICSAHFIKEVLGLRKLTPGAVPTLNLGHNDTFNYYENELPLPPPPPPPKAMKYHNTSTSSNSSMNSTKNFNNSSYSGSSSPNIFLNACMPPTSNSQNVLDPTDYCCVPDCKSTRQTENVTLHTMPRRPEQMVKWCHNLKMDPEKLQKGLRICSLHFESYCIGGCMRPFAVPTLNLGHDDPDIHKNPDVIKKLNIRETCCLKHCKRNRDRDHANLHRFPSNPELLKKWCENLHKPIPDGSRLFNDAICELHFEDRCLRHKRLEKWALPTVNLGHEDIPYKLPSEEEVSQLYPRQTFSLPNTGDEEGICCVETCKRDPKVDDIKLYRPPEDPDVLAKWAHNLQVENTSDLSAMRICNLHFESYCIGKRMRSWAIPTLNLGNNVENLYENPADIVALKRKKKERAMGHHLWGTPFASMVEKQPWAPRCCLPHCRKRRGINNVQLFRIPHNNRSLLAKWCHNLQLPLTSNKHRRICSEHFEKHVLTKRCPMPLAVPTLNLNTPQGYKIYQNPSRLKTAKACVQTICSVPTCNKTRSDGVQLFRLPNNHPQLRKWAHNLRLWEGNRLPHVTQRAQMRVCSSHFEAHSFGAKRLLPGAVPTLNLGYENLDDIYPNEAQPFTEIQCAVKGCPTIKDANNSENVRLFKFPLDEEDALKNWCHNLKMEAIPAKCKGMRICQRHFEEDCLGVKLLYKWALPTLELGQDDSDIEIIPNPKPEDRCTEIVLRCCVPTCGKSRKFDDAQLNSFPKNVRVFRRWKHNLKLDFLDFNKREIFKICNDHFEDICLGKNRLKHGAIPTLNLGHDDTEDLFKVKKEELAYIMFGKPIKASAKGKRRRQEMTLAENELYDDNEDDNELMNSSLEGNQALAANYEMKCTYPDCPASKTLLRELFDMPKFEELLNLWCEYMQIKKEDLPSDSPARLCGLHFKEIYEATMESITNALEAEENTNNMDLLELAGSFNRCCNSLIVRSAQCRVPECTVNGLSQEYRLYQFPYKKELIQKWAENTGVKYDDNRRYLYRICGRHFESYCLTDTLKLRPWAIPTLHLNNADAKELHQNPDLNSVERRMLGRLSFKCCVTDCGRERYEESSGEIVKLFNFPNDEQLVDKWAHNLQLPREQCPLYKICDEHFEPHCFGQSRLRSWAIPTLKLGHAKDIDLFRSQSKSRANRSSNASTFNESFVPTMDVEGETNDSTGNLKCCVTTCGKTTAEHGVNLFKFPTASSMVKKWCYNLQLPAIVAQHPDTRLCHLHFHKYCTDGKLLKVWAVPTLHLGHNEPMIYENPKGTLDEMSNSSLICCLPSCPNHRAANADDTATNIRSFAFPKELERKRKWCENLLLKPTDCKGRICGNHFQPEVILNNRVLKTGAVPTLNLGHNETLQHDNLIALEQDLLEENDMVFHKAGSLILPSDVSSKQKDAQLFNISKASNNSSSLKGNSFTDNYIDDHSHDYKDDNGDDNSSDGDEDQHDDEVGSNNNVDGDDVPNDGGDVGGGGRSGNLRRSASGRNQNGLGANKPSNNFELPSTSKSSNVLKTINRPSNISAPVCCLVHCGRAKTPEQHLTTFAFPKDPTLLQKWCDNLQLKPGQCGGRVCIDHFELRCIGVRRLKPGAVPTLNLGHDLGPKHKYVETSPSQRREAADDGSPYPRIPNYQRDDIEERKSSIELESSTADSGEELPNTTEDEAQHQPQSQIMNNSVFRPCCLKHCRKKKKKIGGSHENLRTYPFPKKNSNLLKKWSEILGLSIEFCNQLGLRLCETHFDPNQIEGDKLKPDSVPSLNLGAKAPIVSSPESSFSDTAKQQQEENEIPTPRGGCIVKDCDSTTILSGKSLYSFPKNTNMCKKWCANLHLNIDDVKYYYVKVCSRHFEPHCIGLRLFRWAVPTLALGHSEDPIYKNPEVGGSSFTGQARCCISSCRKTRYKYNVHLYRFPSINTELGKRWYHNTKQKAKGDSVLRICSDHFDRSEVKIEGKGGRLHAWAVPTLALGHNDPIFRYKARNNGPKRNESDYCCIKHCENSSEKVPEGEKVSARLFPFPQRGILLRKWAHNTQQNRVLVQQHCKKVCESHFAEVCFDFKGDLKSDAIPTLNTLVDSKTNLIELHPYIELPILNVDGLGTLSNNPEVECCVPNCKVGNGCQYIVRHFPFTKDRQLLKKWCHNLCMDPDDCKDAYICSLHFETGCIKNKRLHNLAVPTLNLGYDPENLPIKEFRLFTNTHLGFKNKEYPAAALRDCCVPGCGKSHRNDGVRVFSFPKSYTAFRKWLHNLKIKPSMNESAKIQRYNRICEKHFEPYCIGRHHLQKGSLPTLNLGHDDLANIYRNDENSIVRNPDGSSLLIRNNPKNKSAKKFSLSKCFVSGCTVLKFSKLEVLPLPNDHETRMKWINELQLRDQGAHTKICALHFMYAFRKCCSPSLMAKIKERNARQNTENETSTLAFLKSLSLSQEQEALTAKYLRQLEVMNIKRLSCCVPNCENSYIQNIKFFVFPKAAELFQKWAHNIQVHVPLEKRFAYKVCQVHFEDDCIANTRLRHTAVPTLHLNRPDDELFKNPTYEELSFDQTHSGEFNKKQVCCVESCSSRNSTENTDIEFWKFPNDDEALKKWCHNLNLQEDSENKKSWRLCAQHFEPICFSKQRRLRAWALPTLNLDPLPSDKTLIPNINMQNKKQICCVKSCSFRISSNESETTNIELYKFPDDDEVLNKWRHNLNLQEDSNNTKSLRVCSQHFEPICFSKQKRMRPWALPTLRLDPLPSDKKLIVNLEIDSASLMKDICCIPTCRRVRNIEAGIFLYSFPVYDEERFKKWVHNVRLDAETCRKARICCRHFDASVIGIMRLHSRAVPTLNLGHSDTSDSFIYRQQTKKQIKESRKRGGTNRLVVRVKRLKLSGDDVSDSSDLENENSMLMDHPLIYQQTPRLVADGPYCAVACCSYSRNDGVQLFKYPSNPRLVRIWAENCKHTPYKAVRCRYLICNRHFEEHCFRTENPDISIHSDKKRLRLRLGAVPTLRLDSRFEEKRKNLHQSAFEIFEKVSKGRAMPSTCSVPNCYRSKSSDNVTLHKFPKDPEQLAKWCHNLRMQPEDCKEAVVCNLHFESRCIASKKIYKRAVPTLLLGYNPADEAVKIFENPSSFENPKYALRCCVPECSNARENCDIAFYSFPRLEPLAQKWAENIRLPVTEDLLKYSKVCIEHFEAFCYQSGKLKLGSIPTLKLGHNDSAIHYVNAEELHWHSKRIRNPSTQSDETEIPEEDIPVCCFKDCDEIEKNRTRQVFELPNAEPLRTIWLQGLELPKTNENESNTEPKLCALHFKIMYDRNLEIMNSIKLKVTNENGNAEMLKCLRYLEETNEVVVNSPRLVALQCTVPNCESNIYTKDSPVKLYQFPLNQKLIEKWSHNTKIDYQGYRRHAFRICSLHFEESCFSGAGRRIRSGVIPTLNLPSSKTSNNNNNFLNNDNIDDDDNDNDNDNGANDESKINSPVVSISDEVKSESSDSVIYCGDDDDDDDDDHKDNKPSESIAIDEFLEIVDDDDYDYGALQDSIDTSTICSAKLQIGDDSIFQEEVDEIIDLDDDSSYEYMTT